MYTLTYEALRADLQRAYHDACRRKRRRPYVRHFAEHAAEQLDLLALQLMQRTYLPEPSTCFVISDPKQREVFAARFRDRIVHHLYYNYVHTLFERGFVADSYSCIAGRGTHYGVRRLQQHVRSCSQGYTRPCYVLKLDVRGYFMHISRPRLAQVAQHRLQTMARHRVGCGDRRRWRDVVDIPFCSYLTNLFALYDPLPLCRRVGADFDWQGLPADKSLFASPDGCGLPIGNLTSQLFSNVYLGELDGYVKRCLHCRYYGRYVDDAYVVSHSREQLESLVPRVRQFLAKHLALELHEDKTQVCDARQGVLFLGAYLRPHRSYVGRETLRRMRAKVAALERWALVSDTSPASHAMVALHLRASLNSYLGVLRHHKSHGVAQRLFSMRFARWGYITPDGTRFVPYGDLLL